MEFNLLYWHSVVVSERLNGQRIPHIVLDHLAFLSAYEKVKAIWLELDARDFFSLCVGNELTNSRFGFKVPELDPSVDATYCYCVQFVAEVYACQLWAS